jgi:hypothetical protein
MPPLREQFFGRIGSWLAQPALQGFILLLLLLVIFFWKALFSGQALIASDLLFEIDPLWQSLAHPDLLHPPIGS